jgi:putative ABC transport system permease protein
MWKVTWKGLRAHKLRFALTALAVLLGVAFLSGTMVLTDTIQKTFDELFADINKGTDAVVRNDKVIETDFGDVREAISGSILPEVQKADGVAFAEGSVNINYAQLVDKNGDPVGRPDAGPPALGFAWSDNKDLNPMRLVEGEPPRNDDEIVIDRGSADDGNFHVGDRVKVLTKNEPKVYTVVGIAKFGTINSPGGATITMFTPREAQRVAGYHNQYDQISVVAKDGVSQQQVTENLRAALHDKPVQVITGEQLTKENQDAIQKSLGFFNTALLIFALVALFVGCFIIYNTFSIVVAQRTRELALLRAIGASSRQVNTSVLGESVIVGLLASGVGLLAGIGLAAGLKALLAAFGVDIPAGGAVVASSTIVTAFVVGTVITVLSAIVPARKAGRLAPIAALRDVAIERRPRVGRRGTIGVGILALGMAAIFYGLFGAKEVGLVGIGALIVFIGVFVLGPLIARPVSRVLGAPLPRLRGMTGTLARENASRNPRRTSATAAALMIGVSLVGFITIFAASAKKSVGALIDDQMGTVDYVVTSQAGFSGGVSPDIATKIAALPEVGAVSGLRFGPAEFDGKAVFIAAANAAEASQMFNFDVKQGSLADLGSNGIAVSKKKADKEHWKLGDSIKMSFGKTGTQSLKIQTIYERTELAGTWLMDLSGFERNFGPQYQIDNQVFIQLNEGVSLAQGRAAIAPIVKDYPVAKLRNNAEYKKETEGQVTQIVNLIYVMLLFAVLIALIGIANTLALSIYERTRELGLLRAVGMTRRQVRSSVRWESVIISVFGAVLGLAVGLFFGWAVFAALRDQGFTQFAAAPGQLIVVVILAGIAGVGAAIFPARRAAKLDVLRAITTE